MLATSLTEVVILFIVYQLCSYTPLYSNGEILVGKVALVRPKLIETIG
jgi:hypothetical protein